MKTRILTAIAVIALVAPAIAQPRPDHQQHRPRAAPAAKEASQARQAGAQAAARKGYMAAFDAMHGPMMQALQDSDPDAAFVKGMIPHHQGAIDMARVVLQHGKDEQTRKWANDVIREQQREIGEMQEWLRKRAR